MNILVVDDEKEIADVIALYLQNDEYQVHKFYTGEEALNCIERETIFSSHHMQQWWKCTTCGAIYIEKDPHCTVSEECHICGAKQGAFVKHFGIGA